MKKILIVEDVESWCDLYRMILSDKYALTVAKTYHEAIKHIQKSNFDLAIIDLRLDINNQDNVDGLILINMIKKQCPKTLTVGVSGYKEVFNNEYYKMNQPALQFNKSEFDVDTFYNRIESLLE